MLFQISEACLECATAALRDPARQSVGEPWTFVRDELFGCKAAIRSRAWAVRLAGLETVSSDPTPWAGLGSGRGMHQRDER